MIAWLRKLWHSWRVYLAEIDPNSKCPACGARNGKLKCTQVERNTKPNSTIMVQHECLTCHAVWYEPTILKPELWAPAELLRDKA